MKLSINFSLSEMTKSQMAVRNNIRNKPNEIQIEKLRSLCENVLQPIRDYYDSPVIVSSGFRSIPLCLAIGSSQNSQHAKGEAADFEVFGVSNYDLAVWIKDNLDFDQLILEHYTMGDPSSGWIHCSYKSEAENRKEVLTYTKSNGYRKGLEG